MHTPFAWTLAFLADKIAIMSEKRFAPMEQWLDALGTPADVAKVKAWMLASREVANIVLAIYRSQV